MLGLTVGTNFFYNLAHGHRTGTGPRCKRCDTGRTEFLDDHGIAFHDHDDFVGRAKDPLGESNFSIP